MIEVDGRFAVAGLGGQRVVDVVELKFDVWGACHVVRYVVLCNAWAVVCVLYSVLWPVTLFALCCGLPSNDGFNYYDCPLVLDGVCDVVVLRHK